MAQTSDLTDRARLKRDRTQDQDTNIGFWEAKLGGKSERHFPASRVPGRQAVPQEAQGPSSQLKQAAAWGDPLMVPGQTPTRTGWEASDLSSLGAQVIRRVNPRCFPALNALATSMAKTTAFLQLIRPQQTAPLGRRWIIIPPLVGRSGFIPGFGVDCVDWFDQTTPRGLGSPLGATPSAFLLAQARFSPPGLRNDQSGVLRLP